ncbi:glycosyltransferase family 4 protein [Salinarimonas soli]|uniref:Glycosyltransferase family 4 protein n=1 Tax=Salinarimonas soli TaxID=1638099 RepID=A0A5B2V7M2_9HYPH|nr:glycosyltransferase family 4 protein [Salinarimonas soli]KAA2234778.1 glycosyltransferase family 4 protein [Salinarimonas soli]
MAAAPQNEQYDVLGIVIVSPGGEEGRGGMGTVTRLMAEGLRRDHPGLPVRVIDPRGHGSVAATPWRTARGLLELRAAAGAGANILHLQVSERLSFLRKGAFALAGRALGMTVVLHHHGSELIPFYRSASPGVQRWVRQVARTADLNLALGDLWADFLRAEVEVAPEKVAVLRNGVPDLAEGVTRPPRADAPFKILSVAELSERKGTTQLLEAVAAIARRGVPVEATLAGAGAIAQYAALAERLSISDRTTFTGWVDKDRVRQLLRDAHVLALPSEHEGLPMAIIEAMSLQVPVVATPVGAIPEVFTDGLDCLLVPPRDSDQLGHALERIFRDPAEARAIAARGRETYEANFKVEAFYANLWAFYQRALSSRRAPGASQAARVAPEI